jgi:uncharacterized protein (TIGR04255 family)
LVSRRIVATPKSPPYPNAPLVLTILEIRYPQLSGSLGRSAQQQMREDIRGVLPLVENATEEQLQLAIGAPLPASVLRRSFPRFVARDRTTAAVVKDDALAIETTVYEGWEESFRPLVQRIVDAFARAVSPDGVSRVGLRYVDEIRVPSVTVVPGDWRDFIDGHLLAAADPGFLPRSLKPTVWQGLVQYRTAHDSTLTVRYGPQVGYAVDPQGSTRRRRTPQPGPFFLLDSDSAWIASDEVPEFDVDYVLKLCDLLHEPTREFFRIAVTDKLRDEVFATQLEGNR